MNLNGWHRRFWRLELLLLRLRWSIYLLIRFLAIVLVAVCLVLLVYLKLFWHWRKGDAFRQIRKRVNESSFLIVTMVEWACFAELAVARLHEVLAGLCLVVRMHCSQRFHAKIVRKGLCRIKRLINLHHVACEARVFRAQTDKTVQVGIVQFRCNVCTSGSCTSSLGCRTGPSFRKCYRSTMAAWNCDSLSLALGSRISWPNRSSTVSYFVFLCAAFRSPYFPNSRFWYAICRTFWARSHGFRLMKPPWFRPLHHWSSYLESPFPLQRLHCLAAHAAVIPPAPESTISIRPEVLNLNLPGIQRVRLVTSRSSGFQDSCSHTLILGRLKRR